jgi:phenylacetate-CoA ligase
MGLPVLPLALWSVLKETPDVLKFQAIQISPNELKIRPEARHTEEYELVWKRVHINACDYLTQQGLDNVRIVHAEEPPMRDPKSGKFRNVWAEKFV